MVTTKPTARCAACGRPAYPHPMDTPEDQRQPICAGCGLLEQDCDCPRQTLRRTSHKEV